MSDGEEVMPLAAGPRGAPREGVWTVGARAWLATTAADV